MGSSVHLQFQSTSSPDKSTSKWCHLVIDRQKDAKSLLLYVAEVDDLIFLINQEFLDVGSINIMHNVKNTISIPIFLLPSICKCWPTLPAHASTLQGMPSGKAMRSGQWMNVFRVSLMQNVLCDFVWWLQLRKWWFSKKNSSYRVHFHCLFFGAVFDKNNASKLLFCRTSSMIHIINLFLWILSKEIQQGSEHVISIMFFHLRYSFHLNKNVSWLQTGRVRGHLGYTIWSYETRWGWFVLILHLKFQICWGRFVP